MKLVQLLAKELKEWPEGVVRAWQSGCDNEIYFDGANSEMFYTTQHADDSGYSGSRITRKQWQAEREKMNKPKWIRHRCGNRCVDDDVFVEVKLRCGDVQRGEAKDFIWSHHCCDSAANIMAYRVIEETKDQEIEEVKKTNFGTITYKLEIDATEATQRIDSLVAKWGHIVSPLKWRDAIIHCQAIIEDCEREIERNTQQLAHEGFLLIALITDVSACVPAVDMSDPENWQEGDIVVCVKEEGSCAVLAAGKEYALRISDGDLGLVDEEGDHMCACLTNGQLEFVRRP